MPQTARPARIRKLHPSLAIRTARPKMSASTPENDQAFSFVHATFDTQQVGSVHHLCRLVMAFQLYRGQHPVQPKFNNYGNDGAFPSNSSRRDGRTTGSMMLTSPAATTALNKLSHHKTFFCGFIFATALTTSGFRTHFAGFMRINCSVNFDTINQNTITRNKMVQPPQSVHMNRLHAAQRDNLIRTKVFICQNHRWGP